MSISVFIRQLQFSPVLISIILLLVPSFSSAEEGVRRFEANSGLQEWSDAGDLQNDSGSSFDSGGISLELSLHTTGYTDKPTDWMLGLTLGVMAHDGDINGPVGGDDLDLSTYYLAPSLRWILSNTPARTVFLDIGAGYYKLSIDEYGVECFLDCYIYTYHDDGSFGGFAGLRADFDMPLWDRVNLTASIRAHFVDFEAPTAISANSNLGGAIWQLHFGVATNGF